MAKYSRGSSSLIVSSLSRRSASSSFSNMAKERASVVSSSGSVSLSITTSDLLRELSEGLDVFLSVWTFNHMTSLVIEVDM